MPESVRTNPSRVYIKNLHYLTSEEDLRALFEKYEPYTVKFSKSGKRKPLGFAYVELPTPEKVEAAVKDLDGTVFNGKKLIVKAYTSYRPYQRLWWKRKTPQIENQTEVSQSLEPPVELIAKDRILISKARGNITESIIQQFLKEYNPSNIIICKNKKSIINPMNLTGSYFSVLATVDSSTKKLDEIIESLKSQKLNGKRVELKPAKVDKVEEIEREVSVQSTSTQDVVNDEQSVRLDSISEVSPNDIPLESPDPTSMIVSPGSTLSSNFNAQIHSP
ncbi:RRT5 [Candida margitis]|uniref:RRT5 n=1 Tax=Candida margitis TaxID=1775924 RepID=UPI002225FE97|nr:RRT5 [Candida margitis]KAI5970451.1 RRT5 [Candida margitis]